MHITILSPKRVQIVPVTRRNKPCMYNQYILLRDNKQSGPYNPEDLLQLNIKPFDLIWIQGRSSVWQTADTIAELRSVITPENYSVSTSTAATKFNETSVTNDRFTLSSSSATSGYVYVQLPLMIDFSITEQPGVQEDLEQPKQAIINLQPNTYNSETSAIKQDEVYNYKFLQNIKNEYASWLNQQKPTPKKIILNKLYLTFIYSVIVSMLSLFWKQSKQGSSVEKHFLLQPAKGAKGFL